VPGGGKPLVYDLITVSTYLLPASIGIWPHWKQVGIFDPLMMQAPSIAR
jgi:hypothetical protein